MFRPLIFILCCGLWIAGAPAQAQSLADKVARGIAYPGELRPITEPVRLRLGPTPRMRMDFVISVPLLPGQPEVIAPLMTMDMRYGIAAEAPGLVMHFDFLSMVTPQMTLKASAPLMRASTPVQPNGQLGELDVDFPGFAELGLPGKGSPMAEAMINQINQMQTLFAEVVTKIGDSITAETVEQLVKRAAGTMPIEQLANMKIEATGGSYAAGLASHKGQESIVARNEITMVMNGPDGRFNIVSEGYSVYALRNANILDALMRIKMDIRPTGGAPMQATMYMIMETAPAPDGGI